MVERATPDAHDWLKQLGIGWLPVVLWVERGVRPRGNSVPRFHLTWGTGKYLITRLIEALKGHVHAKKLSLHFGHRVDWLERNGNRVEGLGGVSKYGEFRAEAEAVIVAAGGIGGDLIKSENIGPRVPALRCPRRSFWAPIRVRTDAR